jgi:hypothetical protein
MSCAAATNSLRAVVANAEARLLWPIGMRIAQQLQKRELISRGRRRRIC